MIMNNHTSVIIPYYNWDVDILLSNLKVLTQWENDKHLKEVLIIDDWSKIPLLTYKDTISDISDKIFILFQPNKWSCSARNLGISNSSSEIIVSTDQDCIVDSNRIENIIKPILYNWMVFVWWQTLSYNPNTFISNFVTARKFLRQPVVDENGKINTIITCNCAFLRDIAINIWMFTENSHIITDDLDFTYKFIKSWYQDLLSYNPLAIVYHKHRDSLKNLIKQRFWYWYWSMYHCLLSNRNPQEIWFQYPKIINLLKYTKESLQKSLLVHEKIDEEYWKFNKFCVFPILEFLIRLAKGYWRRKAYVEYNRTTKK
jgi:glycosyltransferase involved in cell wall biosynthesis